MTYFWAKNVIFYAKTSNYCKMVPNEDTKCPNISTVSFFQALSMCQILCFPPLKSLYHIAVDGVLSNWGWWSDQSKILCYSTNIIISQNLFAILQLMVDGPNEDGGVTRAKYHVILQT